MTLFLAIIIFSYNYDFIFCNSDIFLRGENWLLYYLLQTWDSGKKFSSKSIALLWLSLVTGFFFSSTKIPLHRFHIDPYLHTTTTHFCRYNHLGLVLMKAIRGRSFYRSLVPSWFIQHDVALCHANGLRHTSGNGWRGPTWPMRRLLIDMVSLECQIDLPEHRE